jgi:hypothetical protein
MIVIAASLQPNDSEGESQSRLQLPIDDAVAPDGTVAVVLTVESPVYVTLDGSDPNVNGLLLPAGAHQLPIAGGRTLRVNDGEGGWVSLLWLRPRPSGGQSAKKKR